MPVALAGGAPHRVTGAQHAHRSTFGLHETSPRQNNQDLTPIVAVPESARTG